MPARGFARIQALVDDDIQHFRELLAQHPEQVDQLDVIADPDFPNETDGRPLRPIDARLSRIRSSFATELSRTVMGQLRMSRHPARMEAVRLLVDELIAHSLMRDEDAGAMYFDRAVLNWKKSFSYEWVARDMTEEQLADVRDGLMLRPGVDLELLRRELDSQIKMVNQEKEAKKREQEKKAAAGKAFGSAVDESSSDEESEDDGDEG